MRGRALRLGLVVAAVATGAVIWAVASDGGRERPMDWNAAFVASGSPPQAVVVFSPADGEGENGEVLPERARVSIDGSVLTLTLLTDTPRAAQQFAPFGARCVRVKLPKGQRVSAVVDGHDGRRSAGDEPVLAAIKQDPGRCALIPTTG